jgi:NAD(P) transhydrogenase subunit alpha
MKKIGVPREIVEGETRVAVIPAMVKELIGLDAQVLVEKGAGAGAHFADDAYESAGAELVADPKRLYGEVDLVLKVRAPGFGRGNDSHELDYVRESAVLVGMLSPIGNKELIEKLGARKTTSFSLELLPRITRAQSMDALSSMSTVAGYKAVLLATEHYGKFFPLLMTAAGTVPPTSVLVIGAGVAGLQAIATAKRLGAKVEGFDTRKVVKEQIESLGARFVEMEMPEDAQTAGGYAKDVSEEFIRKEMEAIGSRLPKTDIVIATAQVFGKKAPLLVTEDMVKTMREGSVIVDLAAEQGGNCELSRAGEVVQRHGVTIYGPVNLPATMPVHASQMYSRNVTNLVKHLFKADDRRLDFEDEITRSCCVTRDGELINDTVRASIGESSS